MEDNISDNRSENSSSQLSDSEQIDYRCSNRAVIDERPPSIVTTTETICEPIAPMTVSTEPVPHITCDDHQQHGEYIFEDFFQRLNGFTIMKFTFSFLL